MQTRFVIGIPALLPVVPDGLRDGRRCKKWVQERCDTGVAYSQIRIDADTPCKRGIGLSPGRWWVRNLQ